jgi:hypothetical protein
MVFVLFSALVAAVFFVGSLILLNYGRRLGLHHLKREGAGSMTLLTTVEGAVFVLIGLLLAFTISGALQRFDERRRLVIQEANAANTAYDRLALFEGDVARNLQSKLKDYVRARVDLYRMSHDFSLWERTEIFSPEQQDKVIALKNNLWDAAIAACPQTAFRPACSLSLPALSQLVRSRRLRAGASEKHPPQIVYIMLFGLGLGGSLLAGFRDGRGCGTQLDSHGDFRSYPDGDALHCHRHGISTARLDSDRKFRSFSRRGLRANAVTSPAHLETETGLGLNQ